MARYGARTGSASGYGARGSDGRPAKASGGGGSFLDSLGPVGNLLQDAGATIHGLPAGLELAVTHPLTAVKGIAQSYADTYGPLFHGDISGFARGVYQHPLNPLLDVFTLATLGAGGTARAGAALGRAGLIDESSTLARLGTRGTLTYRSPAALAGETGAPLQTKLTSANPLIRARETAVHGLANRFDYNAPVVGELARYTRLARRDASAPMQLLKQQGNDYHDAFSRLNKKERLAFGVLGRVPLPEHLDAWKQMLAAEATKGNEDATRLLETINDPKVAELYANPSKRMLAAHAEAGKLGEAGAQILADKGVLTAAEADAARYRHSRIAGGATVYDSQSARAAVRRINGELKTLRRTGTKIVATAGKLRTKGTPELSAVRAQAAKTAAASVRKTGTAARADAALERIDRLHADLQRTNGQLERLAAGKELSSQELLDAGLKQGSDLPKFRERLTARLYGRATSLAGQYDRSLHEAVRRANIDVKLPPHSQLTAQRAGELEQLRQARTDIAQRLHAGRHELGRIAALEGKLADERSGIMPGIVGGPTVDELRTQLEAAGRPQPIYLPDTAATPRPKTGERGGGAFSYGPPVHKGEGLLFVTGKLALKPDVLGPQFLRTVVFAHYRDLHDALLDAAVKVPKGGKLPAGWVYVKRPAGLPDVPSLNELMPRPDQIPDGFANHGLTSVDSAEALIDHGARYAVPGRMANMLEAEFKRSNSAAVRFLNEATGVWRALVLNLRVGWLTNNVVGNHLLYALHYAGPSGLKGYLDAIAATKGGDIVRRLLNLPETKRSLTQADIAELIPEQAGGTFIGSQAPARVDIPVGGGRSVDVARGARKASLGLAKADKAVESTLRRGAVNTELRRHPAVRARVRAMPKETRSFRTAARQELAANPHLAREISDQVNSALGDFLALSPFEQRYLRGIFPFYAWYKAITKIAAKLPLDYPGRVDMIGRLDQIGLANSNKELGPLPSYLLGSIPLGGDKLLKTQGLNPLETIPQLVKAASVPFVPGGRTNALAGIMNPFVQAGGSTLFGKGSPTKHGLALDLMQGIVTDLPQVGLATSLIKGPKASKLYQPSALDDLLAFLGAPTKTIRRARAEQLAAQGR